MAAMRTRVAAAITVLAFLAASCSSTGTDATVTTSNAGPVSPTTSPTPTTGGSGTVAPAPSTTATVSGIDVAMEGCDQAEGAFAALCQVIELISTDFVDDVDTDALVAGALEGIATLTDAGDGSVPPDAFVCAVPSDAYVPVCDAVAADVAAGDGSVSDVVVQAIQGLLEFGIQDPFSSYLSADALDLFTTNQSGAVEGIGALVQAREGAEDGTEVLCNLLSSACRIYIVAPLDGSPAEAAGIMSGDAIVGVNGESVEGRTFDEVTAEVRGPAGSEVLLTVDRDGSVFDVTVTRASIDIPITDSRMLDGDTGYLRLTSFTNNSAEVFRKDLETLLDAAATTIIFDMQSNPGGSLNAAVSIASEFLSDGLVLRTESRTDGESYPVASGGVATRDVRVIVLVDEGSASAAEVVTGALQEAGRAVVIGENTFGKNTVQRIWVLPDGGGLKLTIARWVTPDGVDYGLDGIAPDVRVDIPVDATAQFLIDAALEYLAEADSSV